MNHIENPLPAPSTPPPTTPKRRLNFALVAGLSALALLWPLAEVTGLPVGPARALIVIPIIAICWIGVVGFGGFPRPVLTLTLAGLGSALIAHALSYVFGEAGVSPAPLWALPLSLAIQMGWGALAGLLAWGIQALRSRPSR